MSAYVGYRAYAMRPDGLHPIALGLNAGVHINGSRATCAADGVGAPLNPVNPDHVIPDVDCGCGYYAMLRETDVDIMRGSFIRAEVSAWGKVQLHEQGWRAEYANVTAVRWPMCMMNGKLAVMKRMPACERPAVQAVEDRGTLLPFCNVCHPVRGMPMNDYLNKLEDQYDCEIKEEIPWKSDDVYESSLFPSLTGNSPLGGTGLQQMPQTATWQARAQLANQQAQHQAQLANQPLSGLSAPPTTGFGFACPDRPPSGFGARIRAFSTALGPAL